MPVVFDFAPSCLNYAEPGKACKTTARFLAAMSAHYRSKAHILQECRQTFLLNFSSCFFYCKFDEEEIDCTTILTTPQFKVLS